MPHSRVLRCAVALALTGALASCDAGSGPSRASTSAAALDTPSSGSAPASSPASSPGTPSSDAPTSATPSVSDATDTTAPSTPCATATQTSALIDCLTTSLDGYWSAQLGTSVRERVVLAPRRSAVPAQCRRGLTAAPAFTCPVDRTLYLTADFRATLDDYPGAERSYAYAVVLGHEMGHLVQLRVHQPQIERDNPSADTTKYVEQQADCLSGVWAHAVESSLPMDPSRFRTVADRVLTGISDAAEMASHGTPAERVAAIDRGLNGTGPAACGLVSRPSGGSPAPSS